MEWVHAVVFFIVSFAASAAGAVCGIGGGVIIKPVLDLTGQMSVSAVSFLSGCTVLTMSLYSVAHSFLAGRGEEISVREATPLALGAAVGGIAGKELFTLVRSCFAEPDRVGAVQAACLAVITLLTLIYTLCKSRVRTHHVTGVLPCAVIGLVLGLCSSFLGIGGGPINLMVLSYCFSMDAKKAAANSLYIILFSQAASLLMTILTGTVPEFELLTLFLMVLGGLLGGAVGRAAGRRIDARAVDRLLIALMGVIILICFCNIRRYTI